jgi:hypothetical protein
MVAKAAKVVAKGSEVAMITKSVKLPLTVSMTGTKEALAEVGDSLVEKLKGELPFTLRLGRGRKEVITVSAK